MQDKYLYFYKAKVISVYDGDTIRADIDLGFSVILHNQNIRLYGIDAPEIRGVERPLGLISRDWLREQLPAGTEIYLESIINEHDKYGRYLGIIHKGDLNINDKLVELKLAKIY